MLNIIIRFCVKEPWLVLLLAVGICVPQRAAVAVGGGHDVETRSGEVGHVTDLVGIDRGERGAVVSISRGAGCAAG